MDDGLFRGEARGVGGGDDLSETRYVTRKDIARMLEVSVNVIYRNETRLGLHIARRDLNERVVRYLSAEVERQLKKRGHI